MFLTTTKQYQSAFYFSFSHGIIVGLTFYTLEVIVSKNQVFSDQAFLGITIS
jgi:hypothetical protein